MEKKELREYKKRLKSLSNWKEVKNEIEEKEASVLFVDIANYTEMSEKSHAYDVVKILSSYFQIAGSIVKANNGRIIDYYGDGFLAIFGLEGEKDHSANLIKAAFTLQEAIGEFDSYSRSIIDRNFSIRLGAHTGKLIYGTIGIKGMEKKTAIGDTVNFASRLEQANKLLNTEFLISESLYNRFDNWSTVNGSYEITAKGKEGVHRVYSLDRELLPLAS